MAVFQADPGQSAGGAIGANIGAVFGGAGSMNAAAIATAKSEATKMVGAAKAGRFRISEEGVKPLLTAIDDIQGDLQVRMQNVWTFEQAPQLGDHPYGHTVAEHDVKSGSGQEGSAQVALTQYRETLTLLKEALQRASGQYHATEDDNQGSFKA